MKRSPPALPKTVAFLWLGLAMTAAAPASAGIWDGCKTIPKYPKGTPLHYNSYPPSGRPEDVISQYAQDTKENVKAWYARTLPSWRFVDHSRDRYPPSWQFLEPNSRRAVVIMFTDPLTIQFLCP
ncbi:MAG: hypothetical protein KIT16_02635 [Rhodospirillaceae bacterium]|nr:hypothetical protein [Rhodospirillaceae bacterium]